MTFVLSILEYASILWSPSTADWIHRIALRSLNWRDRFHLPSFKNRLLLLHVNGLEDRRTIDGLLFIYLILILSSIIINVPQRVTRNYTSINTNFSVSCSKDLLRPYPKIINHSFSSSCHIYVTVYVRITKENSQKSHKYEKCVKSCGTLSNTFCVTFFIDWK